MDTPTTYGEWLYELDELLCDTGHPSIHTLRSDGFNARRLFEAGTSVEDAMLDAQTWWAMTPELRAEYDDLNNKPRRDVTDALVRAGYITYA